jgi:hypothetical protein
MLQNAKELVASQITNAELKFVRSDVFDFNPFESSFDLVLCLGLIAHVGRLGAALQIGTSSEEIAAGLKQLIEMSDDDLKVMGDRGRTLVATKFSWPQIGEQMHAVYEWMLGGGATPQSVRL